MGNSGIATDEPVTIPQFFTKTFEALPEVKALCWKDKKEDTQKSLTHTEYKNLIYKLF